MFIEWVLLGKVLKLYLVHKSKNRDFHNASLQNALTRNLGQRLNTHSVSQGHILFIVRVIIAMCVCKQSTEIEPPTQTFFDICHVLFKTNLSGATYGLH